MATKRQWLADVWDLASCVLLLLVIMLGIIAFFPALLKLVEMSMNWWFAK